MHSRSVTAAAQRHHVVILLQNHVFLIIEIQQTDGLESVGDTAGRPHLVAGELERMHDGAHRGVVGRSEVSPQGERAGAFAVVGVVSPGGDDPARPADLLKVDEEGDALAGLGAAVGQETWRRTSSPAAVLVELSRCSCWLGLSCGMMMIIFGQYSIYMSFCLVFFACMHIIHNS